MEPLWSDEPTTLFTKDNWWKFVPTATSTQDIPTAMNAILRFSVYLFTLLFLATGKSSYLVGIPMAMILTVLAAKIFPRVQGLFVESFKDTVDALINDYTYPTAKNPFMNPLLTEILDNPNRLEAAPVTSTEVKEKIKEAFQQTSDLYMDTSDKFDMAQAMRTFHTVQSGMIPNDQDGFLKFLAKGTDEPDFSSAFPSRNAKKKSEGHVEAIGSMTGLPNFTSMPTGVTPAGTA
jgi:hypothetical protein